MCGLAATKKRTIHFLNLFYRKDCRRHMPVEAMNISPLRAFRFHL